MGLTALLGAARHLHLTTPELTEFSQLSDTLVDAALSPETYAALAQIAAATLAGSGPANGVSRLWKTQRIT